MTFQCLGGLREGVFVNENISGDEYFLGRGSIASVGFDSVVKTEENAFFQTRV